MFDRVTIRASDRYRSEAFYRCVLGALGIEPTEAQADLIAWDDFAVVAADTEHPPTRYLHIAFVAWSRQLVDRFHRAGLDAGYASDGDPGARPQYKPSYYGGFLLDPDGNSVEAVHHDDVRRGGHIDHLWIGVRDLEQSAAFYDLIAPHTGLRQGSTWEGAHQLRGAWATFALIDDGRPPTSGLHLAFPAPDRQTVADFHSHATAAGYRDSSPPGERPRQHPGYYAATVLDPGGTSVESVFHGRG